MKSWESETEQKRSARAYLIHQFFTIIYIFIILIIFLFFFCNPWLSQARSSASWRGLSDSWLLSEQREQRDAETSKHLWNDSCGMSNTDRYLLYLLWHYASASPSITPCHFLPPLFYHFPLHPCPCIPLLSFTYSSPLCTLLLYACLAIKCHIVSYEMSHHLFTCLLTGG